MDLISNNITLLEEPFALELLSNNVTAVLVQQSFTSGTVVEEIVSEPVSSSNILVESLSVPVISASREKGMALKLDFKSMYSDFHLAGYSL